MTVFFIFTVSMLWLISLIGSSVTGTLFLINVGEGDSDWQKKFWWDFCKKNLIWFSLYGSLFVLANYLFFKILSL